MSDEEAAPKRKRGQRGLGKRPRMILMTVRLPPEVAAYYHGLPKYTKRLRDVLVDHARVEIKEVERRSPPVAPSPD